MTLTIAVVLVIAAIAMIYLLIRGYVRMMKSSYNYRKDSNGSKSFLAGCFCMCIVALLCNAGIPYLCLTLNLP